LGKKGWGNRIRLLGAGTGLGRGAGGEEKNGERRGPAHACPSRNVTCPNKKNGGRKPTLKFRLLGTGGAGGPQNRVPHAQKVQPTKASATPFG